MEITLEKVKSAYKDNGLVPVVKKFGGKCQNGQYACCPMMALYIDATKDFPTKWEDNDYSDKVVDYLRQYEPNINYLAIGWDNYFPTQELEPRQKELFALGLEAVKELIWKN